MHVIQLYPSIALEISYPSTTELFFCFKPIIDLLSFTAVRQLRESVAEKLMDDFVPYCQGSMTREGFNFVKEKLGVYAASNDIDQPNRNKLYALIECMELAAEDCDFDAPIESGRPRIGLKSALTKANGKKRLLANQKQQAKQKINEKVKEKKVKVSEKEQKIVENGQKSKVVAKDHKDSANLKTASNVGKEAKSKKLNKAAMAEERASQGEAPGKVRNGQQKAIIGRRFLKR